MRTQVALVRFVQDLGEIEDYARENFPDLHLHPEQQLLAQFRAELYENPKMRGRFENPFWVVSHRVENDAPANTFIVLGFYTHQHSDTKSLVAEIQKCYDDFGMSGEFDVLLTNTLPA